MNEKEFEAMTIEQHQHAMTTIRAGISAHLRYGRSKLVNEANEEIAKHQAAVDKKRAAEGAKHQDEISTEEAARLALEDEEYKAAEEHSLALAEIDKEGVIPDRIEMPPQVLSNADEAIAKRREFMNKRAAFARQVGDDTNRSIAAVVLPNETAENKEVSDTIPAPHDEDKGE